MHFGIACGLHGQGACVCSGVRGQLRGIEGEEEEDHVLSLIVVKPVGGRSAYQVPVNKPGQWANLFPCSFCQRSIYSFCGIVRCS